MHFARVPLPGICLIAYFMLPGLSPVFAANLKLPSSGPEARFPKDSGMVDVTDNTFTGKSIKADGRTDDTEALNKLIEVAAPHGHPRTYGNVLILYFPAGTYLTSDSLKWLDSSGNWYCYVSLQGHDRSDTIIRLAKSAAGFDDPSHPKAMIVTASQKFTVDHSTGPDGGGNEAFFNNISDLTVDTGTAHPGAVGIDYSANNIGAIRSVNVRGVGVAGIDLSRSEPGPCMAENVAVTGFDYGVLARNNITYCVTFRNLTLRHQKKLAFTMIETSCPLMDA